MVELYDHFFGSLGSSMAHHRNYRKACSHDREKQAFYIRYDDVLKKEDNEALAGRYKPVAKNPYPTCKAFSKNQSYVIWSSVEIGFTVDIYLFSDIAVSSLTVRLFKGKKKGWVKC
jgi:hypothetical protein